MLGIAFVGVGMVTETLGTESRGSLAVGIPAYEESYEHESRAFAEAITVGTPLLSTLEDAATVSRITAAVYDAAARHAAVERGGYLDEGARRW